MNTISNCGTIAGWGKHRRLKEQSCDLCRQAYNQYMREWKTVNRDKVLAGKKEYKIKHQARFRALKTAENHKRRAIKRNGKYIPYTLDQVLDAYGTVCYLCEMAIDLTLPRSTGQPGWEMGLHLDHAIPLAKGGIDCLDNVAPTHAICNLRKGAN